MNFKEEKNENKNMSEFLNQKPRDFVVVKQEAHSVHPFQLSSGSIHQQACQQ
jgi:hypothetical protein